MGLSYIERQSRPDGSFGQFATQDIEPEDTIHALDDGPIYARPTRESIQIGESEHIEDSKGKWINHDCFPNACVRGPTIQATQRIPKGTEVTFDYRQSEDRLAHPFPCDCCGQWIQGKQETSWEPFDIGSEPHSILRRQLDSTGVAYLPGLLTEGWHQRLLQERDRLAPYARDKNFVMPPFGTLRISQTIGGKTITDRSPMILAFYEFARRMLEAILGIPLFRCPHDQEFAVLNHLHRAGAEHGWHMDDPSHVLVVSLVSPLSAGDGGQVEFVPNVIADTSEAIELAVSSATEEGRITRLFLHPRDAYLIRGDRTLHRVAPLRNGERLIIAFSYDDQVNKNYANTADALYD